MEMVDAVRNIGNFAAHPMKSQKSGEILPVEPGEAEWNLDVLESLFDFFFVQPTLIRGKREALNKKLAEAGKPPVNWPPNPPFERMFTLFAPLTASALDDTWPIIRIAQ
jgi:hypothetical protein